MACKGEYPRARDLPKDFTDSQNLRDCRTMQVWAKDDVMCPGCGRDAAELGRQRTLLTEEIAGTIDAGNAARALQLYRDDHR